MPRVIQTSRSRTSHVCQPPISLSISIQVHRNDTVTSHQTLQKMNTSRNISQREGSFLLMIPTTVFWLCILAFVLNSGGKSPWSYLPSWIVVVTLITVLVSLSAFIYLIFAFWNTPRQNLDGAFIAAVIYSGSPLFAYCILLILR